MAHAQNTTNEKATVDQLKAMNGKVALQCRLDGVLPMIDIAGHLFTVEIAKDRLRPRGIVSSDGLNLKTGGWRDDRTHQHCFYYDTNTKTEVKIDPDILRVPKNVVLIKVPDAHELDPVAMAQKAKIDPELYVKMYPLKMFRTAEVISLQDTVMMDVARKNRENQYYEKKQIKNKRGPKSKKGIRR